MYKKIVQMNNSFIQNEHQRRRYLMEERQRRNRFMGWVLILIMLLFILPTYNLAQSYQQLLSHRQQLAELKKQYEELSDEKDKEASFATKLKDESYAANILVQNIIIRNRGRKSILFRIYFLGNMRWKIY